MILVGGKSAKNADMQDGLKGEEFLFFRDPLNKTVYP